MALNPHGDVLWTNQPWRALFGINSDDARVAGMASWFPEESTVDSTLREVAGSDGIVGVRARRSNGVPFTMAILAAIDQVSGDLVCVGREITGGDQ